MSEAARKRVGLDTVKNVGASVVDVEDGRSFGPGETLEDVNLRHPHNERLVTAGLIAAVKSNPTPAKIEEQ